MRLFYCLKTEKWRETRKVDFCQQIYLQRSLFGPLESKILPE